MSGKLLLIDASSTIFRAFYAIPTLTNAAGVPINATLGFTTMVQKILRERAPDYLVVVWDSPGEKRRKQLYSEYKANRDSTPEDLKTQFANIRRVVEAYGFESTEFEGEEADDVIATLVRAATAKGLEVEIASTDRDMMQLVTDRVTVIDTMKDRRFGPEEVEARFGVPPESVLDFRSLVGDSSDNIPGVKGIGEKGAAKLIGEFGTLDELLQRIDEIPAKRAREALREGADVARLSRELSRLRDDLPIELDLERARIPEPDREALVALFRELEFKRLLEQYDEDVPQSPAVETRVQIVREASELEALVARLAGAPRIALSCALEPEDAMRGELVAIALTDSSDEAFLLRMADLGESTALRTLRPALESESRTWIGHDLKRCANALGRRGIELGGRLHDVALAAYIVDPSQQVQRPEVLARTYLGVTLLSAEDRFGKGAKRRTAQSVPAAELGEYLGAQAAHALPLEETLENELRERGQLELYEDLEVPLLRVLSKMERVGVRVDEAKLVDLARQLSQRLGDVEDRIHGLAGETFNIGSPRQLQRILFEKLKLPPTKKTKTGFSTDESVLEDLAAQGQEIPAEILTYRRLSKLKSTYVDSLPGLVHPETGRIHTTFNQIVAATGRLSSQNPNLQNIPVRTPEGREIRAAFIPGEGRLLLSADYSQIELRVLAHLSGDAGLVEAFRRGADIHVRTASQVFGIPEGEVSAEQRSRTKAINFGIIYGQSSFGLARTLGIAQSEAAEHIKAYFERYPGVKAFLERAVADARQRGYAETLFGRRRYLPDLHSRNRVQRAAAERMAMNSVLQGTAADLIKRAMVEIDRQLGLPGAPDALMILQVHDELLFEAVPNDLAALTELVQREMRSVAELSVPLEVHIGSGRSWIEAH